jgi:hypothetical protein
MHDLIRLYRLACRKKRWQNFSSFQLLMPSNFVPAIEE